jgi:hypothetical protein
VALEIFHSIGLFDFIYKDYSIATTLSAKSKPTPEPTNNFFPTGNTDDNIPWSTSLDDNEVYQVLKNLSSYKSPWSRWILEFILQALCTQAGATISQHLLLIFDWNSSPKTHGNIATYPPFIKAKATLQTLNIGALLHF